MYIMMTFWYRLYSYIHLNCQLHRSNVYDKYFMIMFIESPFFIFIFMLFLKHPVFVYRILFCFFLPFDVSMYINIFHDIVRFYECFLYSSIFFLKYNLPNHFIFYYFVYFSYLSWFNEKCLYFVFVFYKSFSNIIFSPYFKSNGI